MIPMLSGTEALQLNGSLFVVSIVFILFHLLMRRLLYRPLFGVMEERDRLTEGKQAQAGHSRQQVQELLGRYEAAIKEAKQTGFQQIEKTRAATLARQGELLAAAHAEVDHVVQAATTDLSETTHALKQTLAAETPEIARLMARQILGRESRP